MMCPFEVVSVTLSPGPVGECPAAGPGNLQCVVGSHEPGDACPRSPCMLPGLHKRAFSRPPGGVAHVPTMSCRDLL